jgi:hypothetical protein
LPDVLEVLQQQQFNERSDEADDQRNEKELPKNGRQANSECRVQN